MYQTNSLPLLPEPIPMRAHTEPETVVPTLRNLGVRARNASAAVAAPMGAMLGPFVAVAYAFAAWCLIANMRPKLGFLWPEGPFSNWMVWVAMALLLQYGSARLSRIGPRHPAAAGQKPNGLDRFLTEMKVRNERVLLAGSRPNHGEHAGYWRDAA